MILIDTSIWIMQLNDGPVGIWESDLFFQTVTCNPVLQEVLQGLRENPAHMALRQAFLALPRLHDPVPIECYISAADIYRHGRQRGYTIRSSVDCLIAAIAIATETPVWHRDRDFDTLAKFTPLKIWKSEKYS